MELDVRVYPLIALLALVPVAAFVLGRSMLAVLSLVSVLVIAGSLSLLFGIVRPNGGEPSA